MFLDTIFFQMPGGIILIGILGLMVGSFLNVVIYRLPIMMNRAEKLYAWEVLHEHDHMTTDNPYNEKVRFNLMIPGSRCPHCGTEIRFWQNIPVVSYLLQRGRCVGCGTKITIRYLLVEVLCAVLSILVVLKYPDPWQLAFALLLTWSLLALIFIDAEQQILPDIITLPLMWLGIIAACIHNGLFIALQNTSDSLLERMAVLPRYMEANGLDANAFMLKKLEKDPSKESLREILRVILDEEISHVNKGDRWFKFECERFGLSPSIYISTVQKIYPKAFLQDRELNVEARLKSGFTQEELTLIRNLSKAKT